MSFAQFNATLLNKCILKGKVYKIPLKYLAIGKQHKFAAKQITNAHLKLKL